MLDVHELAELAPRDVVARAIQDQVAKDGGKPVYLDLRHLDPELVARRFPTIAERLATYGLNLASDLIPVAPAAHYFMGGIVADTQGRTSMDGLLAIGEVSCTGVHGANRLASNSLLEGLVFGLRAAENLESAIHTRPDAQVTPDALSDGATRNIPGVDARGEGRDPGPDEPERRRRPQCRQSLQGTCRTGRTSGNG